MGKEKITLIMNHAPLSCPPLPPKVVSSLANLRITTREQLLDLGIISAFLLLKSSGLTITQSVLWQLWAFAFDRPLTQLSESQKQLLKQALKEHPPVALFPPAETLDVFMTEALAEAQKACQLNEVPIGCVIVAENQIIGRGHNQCLHQKQVTAHAELLAIAQASRFLDNYRLDGCDLYTTVEPCPMCASAIIQARVKRVMIGTMEARTGAAGSIINLFANRKINSHTSVRSGIRQADCQAVLKQFFAQKRNAQ